jgi:class 3 adenylate cyclase
VVILAVDVAGFSRLMGEYEEGTLAALRAVRRELGDAKIAEHCGRFVKTTGDGLLIAFAGAMLLARYSNDRSCPSCRPRRYGPDRDRRPVIRRVRTDSLPLVSNIYWS